MNGNKSVIKQINKFNGKKFKYKKVNILHNIDIFVNMKIPIIRNINQKFTIGDLYKSKHLI